MVIGRDSELSWRLLISVTSVMGYTLIPAGARPETKVTDYGFSRLPPRSVVPAIENEKAAKKNASTAILTISSISAAHAGRNSA
jgi:hypothetical protein